MENRCDKMENRYDKMDDYINSIFNVFKMVNKKASEQKNERMKTIALVIYNYVRYMAYEYDIRLTHLTASEEINLIPIFEYVSTNNIELYDFKTINIDDLDIKKNEDLERFVLTHIYYITQGQ